MTLLRLNHQDHPNGGHLWELEFLCEHDKVEVEMRQLCVMISCHPSPSRCMILLACIVKLQMVQDSKVSSSDPTLSPLWNSKQALSLWACIHCAKVFIEIFVQMRLC